MVDQERFIQQDRRIPPNWWRGLRAHSGHSTGSISTSERAVRVRAPVLRLVFPD